MKHSLHPGFYALVALLLTTSFMRSQPSASQSVIASSATRSDLTAPDLCIPLRQKSSVPLKKQLDSIPSDRRLYLVLTGLQAATQPGVLYAVYLEPTGTQTHTDSSRVGYINFFAVSAGSKGNPFSFEVTQSVRSLLSAKPDLSGLQVRIVPADHPQSTPSIGNIELVAY